MLRVIHVKYYLVAHYEGVHLKNPKSVPRAILNFVDNKKSLRFVWKIRFGPT